jgi:hypothetical protein
MFLVKQKKEVLVCVNHVQVEGAEKQEEDT